MVVDEDEAEGKVVVDEDEAERSGPPPAAWVGEMGWIGSRGTRLGFGVCVVAMTTVSWSTFFF